MQRDTDAELTRNLRPRWHSHWYGIAVLTVITGFCSVVPLSVTALRRPPSDASLRRSLLVAARPKVTELRKKLSKRGVIGESNSLYFRTPECVVKDIAGTKLQHSAGSGVTGLVFVSCVWKSADQRTFDSREEAQDAELTESEPGKVRLTFVWQGEHWQYKGAKKD